jgi:hypothetical protein
MTTTDTTTDGRIVLRPALTCPADLPERAATALDAIHERAPRSVAGAWASGSR